MENQKTFKISNKVLARMQVVHLGKILFNLQFVVLAIMVASILSFIMPAIYYIVLIFVALLSLFTLLANPKFTALLSGGESLGSIAEVLTQSWKYTVPILVILAVLSIVCLCFDKNEKHIARIVGSAIICLLAFIVLFFKLANTGVFA